MKLWPISRHLKNRSCSLDISSTILIMLRGEAKEVQPSLHPPDLHTSPYFPGANKWHSGVYFARLTVLNSSGPNAATRRCPLHFLPIFFVCRVHSLNMSESLKTRGRRSSPVKTAADSTNFCAMWPNRVVWTWPDTVTNEERRSAFLKNSAKSSPPCGLFNCSV